MKPENEELLIAVLAGDVSEQDARVQRARSEDPQFARQLDELRGIERRLSAARPQGINELSAIEGEAEIVEEFQQSVRPARRWSGPAGLLAIAAGIIGLFWVGTLFLAGENPGSKPITLSGQLEGYAPVGTVEGFDVFRWPDPLPPNGSYELMIRAADSGAQLILVEGLESAEWKPDATQALSWPARIEWRLTVLDGSGALHGSPRFFSAQRR